VPRSSQLRGDRRLGPSARLRRPAPPPRKQVCSRPTECRPSCCCRRWSDSASAPYRRAPGRGCWPARWDSSPTPRSYSRRECPRTLRLNGTPRCARCSRPSSRRIASTAGGRRRVALVRDLATDTWLAGALTGKHRAAPWEALLDSAIAAAGRGPDVVLGEGSPAGTVDPSPACTAALRELRPVHADAALLASGHDEDLADGLAARAVIRELAGRLPGFGRSTWAYVVERFLPPRGIVATAPERIHAELPAAALAIVLVMAGLDTFSFRVPWLEQEVLVSHRGD